MYLGAYPKRVLAVMLLAVLAVVAAACTIIFEPDDVTVRSRIHLRFGIELSPIITVFEPTRGDGSVYRVAEDIQFRIRTTHSGYVTLSAKDPDGFVYVFARNIPVTGGRTHVIPPVHAGYVFNLRPPRGLHLVRASFTPERTDRTIRYTDQRGDHQWTQTIVTEIRPYPSTVRDVAETSFYLR